MKCPVIETLVQAEAFGKALAEVSPMAPGWAVEVFKSSSSITYRTGPQTLNDEIKSMWESYMTKKEKEDLLKHYTINRLAR